MSVQITDGITAATVDPTFKALNVQATKTVTQAGFAGLAALRDPGAVTGAVTASSIDASPEKRIRCGLDTPLFADQINYTAQNTSVWTIANATMILAFGSGYADINSGNDVTSGHYAVLKTYRSFPIYNEGSLLVEWHGGLTQTAQANNAIYMGVGLPGSTAGPTDGVYFQLDATGVLRGVVNYSGTQLTTAALTAPSITASHFWRILIDDTVAEFWIDGVLQGAINLAANASASGTPSLGGAEPFFIQNVNTGTVATAQHFHLQNVQVYQMDTNTGRPWPHILAGMGQNAIQAQNGATMGSTALYANNTAPAAAVPSNTTAALGSGLGGNFYETATLAVGTDGIVSSFQNPAGSVNQTPRNLIVTGLRWSSMVQTVLGGGPFVYECGLALGHTAVSLATGESANAKAPRRFPVGLYTLAATAPVGSAGAAFVHAFATPLVVQPGEFIQTIVRNIGTLGTAGTIAHLIGIEGYWE